MASTAKEEKYARTYYKNHKKYREKKIKQRSDDYQQHKKQEATYSREYYAKNPSYRRYKIAYARAYQRKHNKKKN